jgi:hypothetical protein
VHLIVGQAREIRDPPRDRFARLRFRSTGKTGDDVTLEERDFLFGLGGDSLLGGRYELRIVIRSGIPAAQHENVITDEVDQVEAQRPAARGQSPGEIRTRPADDGHEIVADEGDAGAAEASQRSFPSIDRRPRPRPPSLMASGTGIDSQTLHFSPAAATVAF